MFRGLVIAGELYIGDKLLNSKGNILLVEDMRLETTEISTPVYNFQVEDFHTYYVGEPVCGQLDFQQQSDTHRSKISK